MTRKISVSAVSYLNTAPFVYGLQHSGIRGQIDLSLDYPAECARKLQSGEVEVGLIPVAAIPHIPNYEIITDYCIGAEKRVRTVMLLSNHPVEEIEKIYLDYQSRTSVVLVRVLARDYWKLKPEWLPFTPSHSTSDIEPHEGVVIIGDRVFDLEHTFKYRYDLAEEWNRFTGLPFVFAAWAANKPLDRDFVFNFNKSFSIGLISLPSAIDYYDPKNISKLEAEQYLRNNISFELDSRKREAIKLFWSLAREISPG